MYKANIKQKLIKNINKKIELIIEEFQQNKNFLELIEKQIFKDYGRIIHIEYDILTLIFTVNEIKKVPKLKERLELEVNSIEEFYESLQKCEICIYTLFTEIEKINFIQNNI